MTKTLFAIALIIFGAQTFGANASFDCRKASSSVERMICENNEISSLDFKLGQLYRDRKSDPAIVASEKEWIAIRNNCTTQKCLKDAYLQRIGELYQSGQSERPAKPNPVAQVDSDADGQQELAGNEGASNEPTNPSAEQVFDSASTVQSKPSAAGNREEPENGIDTPNLQNNSAASGEAQQHHVSGREALIYGGGVVLVLLSFALQIGYRTRCPKCGKWFAGKEASRKFVGSSTEYKEVQRSKQITDRDNRTIRHEHYTESVPVNVNHYEVAYYCKACGNHWIASEKK